jgi:hypothetical protein
VPGLSAGNETVVRIDEESWEWSWKPLGFVNDVAMQLGPRSRLGQRPFGSLVQHFSRCSRRVILFGGLSELSMLGLLDELTQMTFDCLNPYQPERKGWHNIADKEMGHDGGSCTLLNWSNDHWSCISIPDFVGLVHITTIPILRATMGYPIQTRVPMPIDGLCILLGHVSYRIRVQNLLFRLRTSSFFIHIRLLIAECRWTDNNEETYS